MVFELLSQREVATDKTKEQVFKDCKMFKIDRKEKEIYSKARNYYSTQGGEFIACCLTNDSTAFKNTMM